VRRGAVTCPALAPRFTSRTISYRVDFLIGVHPRTQFTPRRRGMSEQSSILQPGTPAPDFTLPVTADQTVSLADFRGRPLIIAFYPNDWSPVCGDQMALYNEILSEFHKHHANILGISVDSAW
jgi:peroxiredoxin